MSYNISEQKRRFLTDKYGMELYLLKDVHDDNAFSERQYFSW